MSSSRPLLRLNILPGLSCIVLITNRKGISKSYAWQLHCQLNNYQKSLLSSVSRQICLQNFEPWYSNYVIVHTLAIPLKHLSSLSVLTLKVDCRVKMLLIVCMWCMVVLNYSLNTREYIQQIIYEKSTVQLSSQVIALLTHACLTMFYIPDLANCTNGVCCTCFTLNT